MFVCWFVTVLTPTRVIVVSGIREFGGTDVPQNLQNSGHMFIFSMIVELVHFSLII